MALFRRSVSRGSCAPGCWLEKGGCYCPDLRSGSRVSAFNGLGIIPDFQFYNPPYSPEGYLVNSHLQFTQSVPNQLTVQPVGPYVTSGDANLQGLGVTMVHDLPLAAAGAGISGVFDSWWWQNRRWLAVGAISLLGLGAIGIATKVLK